MFGAAYTMYKGFIQGSTHLPSRDKNNPTELMFFESPFTAHNPLFHAHINFDVINPMDNFAQEEQNNRNAIEDCVPSSPQKHIRLGQTSNFS